MSNIAENLERILSSRYGKDVRQAIHDSISDCYEDGRAGATDLVARQNDARQDAEIEEIKDTISKQGKNLARKRFTATISYAAGTVGSYATSVTTDVRVEGYTPIAVSISNMGWTLYNANSFFNSAMTHVYTTVYRASSAAANNSTVTFEVLYARDNTFDVL